MTTKNAFLFAERVADLTSFHMVLLTSGFDTQSDETARQSFDNLGQRVSDGVLLSCLYLPEESRQFADTHDLHRFSMPLLVLSQENPYGGEAVDSLVVLELGKLGDADSIKSVLGSIASVSHEQDFLRRAKLGELARRVERIFGKLSGPVKDCVTMVGLGT